MLLSAQTPGGTSRNYCLAQWWLLLVLMLPGIAHATDVSFSESFAGRMNFTTTGGTLRSQPNGTNACSLNASDTASINVVGLPSPLSIVATYVYWAGSGSTPDTTITLSKSGGNTENISVLPGKTFTEDYIGTYFFFGGVGDATNVVNGDPNGTYTFSNLTVDSSALYCNVQAVLSGWGLIVVYRDDNAAPTEPLRVINLFDGLQAFRNTSIALTPDNFQVDVPEGKLAILSWEGDDTLGGANENIFINSNPVPLQDTLNPPNFQFNGTVNIINDATTYGVDFDTFDIGTYLNPGDTDVTTLYSAANDLVLLSLEAISTSNVAVADLSIVKSLTSTLIENGTGQYSVVVTNNGPSDIDSGGTITVTDTLDGDLTFSGATSTGSWACVAAGQDVTCTHPGPLNNGASLDTLFIGVTVADSTAGNNISNTATVTSTAFDNISGNDSSTQGPDTVIASTLDAEKRFTDLNGGEVDAGDSILYEIELTETGGVAINDLDITDNIPANLNGFTVLAWPTGSSNNSSGPPAGTSGNGLLQIDDIDIPANSTVLIQYSVTVDGGVTPGDNIANIATIDDPADTFDRVLGPVSFVISPSQIPAAGVKNLYLDPTAGVTDMARTIPANSSPPAVDPITFTQVPDLARDLTLNAGIVQVDLCMGTVGGDLVDYTATLSYAGASSGTIGSPVVRTNQLGNGVYEDVTLNFTLGADLTILDGSRLVLNINRDDAGTIFYTNFDNGANCTITNAVVKLDTSTVINVESLDIYDATFPGGSIVTEVTDDGTDVFARAVISDPFGSFDITAATATVRDVSNNIVDGPTAMTLENDNVADGERTYEHQFTIPAFANGPYVVEVVADEGTEGTISDTSNTGLTVNPELPTIGIGKVASVSEAVPGDPITYTITVTNTGPGVANDVVIEDNFDNFTSIEIGSIVFDPLTSTLTMDTPVYSDDDGISFAYTLVSGAGGASTNHDGLATDVQISFTGTMPASSSFTITYDVEVE